MNTKVKLRVQGLTNSQVQSGAYALILAEENGLRRVPIIVGTAEAQSIAIALENLIPPRPLTHDLFVRLFQTTNTHLVEVFIYKFEEGIFYSELVLKVDDRLVRVDSRTSDAVAIALRVNCSIYTTEALIKESGVVLESDVSDDDADEPESQVPEPLDLSDIKSEEQLKGWLQSMPMEELGDRLSKAIENEDYESAQIYRDGLNRRTKSSNN